MREDIVAFIGRLQFKNKTEWVTVEADGDRRSPLFRF